MGLSTYHSWFQRLLKKRNHFHHLKRDLVCDWKNNGILWYKQWPYQLFWCQPFYWNQLNCLWYLEHNILPDIVFHSDCYLKFSFSILMVHNILFLHFQTLLFWFLVHGTSQWCCQILGSCCLLFLFRFHSRVKHCYLSRFLTHSDNHYHCLDIRRSYYPCKPATSDFVTIQSDK